jgi:hypothetical protein
MRQVAPLFLGLVLSMLLFSSFQISESILWDLLIDVSLEKNPIQVYENPIVNGTIVDHAGKPVSSAEVKISLENESVITLSNATGEFRHEFENVTAPGYYIVNVVASTNDTRMGIAQTYFQVKGPISVSSQTAYNLDLINSTHYQKINPNQKQEDPIAFTLYNYYQDLQIKFQEEEEEQKLIDEYQQYLQEQRRIANELQEKIIEEENPGAGTYTGWKYDKFVDNLDLDVKEIIVNQLNYTINVFEKAQFAMEEVLENGGTMEEARQAYYEKASIPRELMESLSSTQIDEIGFAGVINSTSNNEELLEMIYNQTENDLVLENATNNTSTIIELPENVTTIYLNVNGTIIELFVNGTKITQIGNST